MNKSNRKVIASYCNLPHEISNKNREIVSLYINSLVLQSQKASYTYASCGPRWNSSRIT